MASTTSPHQAMLRWVAEGRVEPGAVMQWMIHAYRYSQLAFAMADLGIADLLADGPLSTADISRHAGVPEAELGRLLHGLAWCGALSQERQDTEGELWALTALGQALITDGQGSLADDAVHAGSLLYPAWGKLAVGLRTEQVPFEQAHGRGFFEEIANDPAASERFDRVMNRAAVLTAQALAETLDLSTARCIVDVGGGNGETLARLLAGVPEARGIVFDRARAQRRVPARI